MARLVLTLFEMSQLRIQARCYRPLKEVNQAVEHCILSINDYSGFLALRTDLLEAMPA